MQNSLKHLELIRSSSGGLVVMPILQPSVFIRVSNPDSRLKGSYISHRSLSSLEERALYYSSLCSQHRVNTNKKADIVSDIKLRIARITARKPLADKQKPKKKKILSPKNTINLHLGQIPSASFKVSQEILVEKPNKRKVIRA